MSHQDPTFSEERAQERLQMIDMLKAPIIQMGRDLGYEVIENHDLGAGPVHVACSSRGPSRCRTCALVSYALEFSDSSINEGVGRAMLNLIDKLVFVVPTESMTGQVKEAIESMPDKSILQLRKYVTVLTPSTLVSKTGIQGAHERDSLQTGEAV